MFDEDVEGIDIFRSSSMGQVIAGALGSDNPFNRPRRRTVDPVDARAAQILRERADADEAARVEVEAQRKIAEVEALGADQLPDGAVVAFTKQHTVRGHAFSYAAIYIAGHWYLTGGKHGGAKKTNEEFCLWLLSGQGFNDWQVLRGAPEAPHDVVPASYHDNDDEEPF